MKRNHLLLGLSLILLSFVLHGIHYAIFKDMHHLMIFLVADIAFVPLEVFFVSMVLEQLIKKQEEEKVIKKMNMLVGLFYQEFGNKLLSLFVNLDNENQKGNKKLLMDFEWDNVKYKELLLIIEKHNHNISLNTTNLEEIYTLLKSNRNLMINLISNPILLEKEVFSEVLMSTFHLLDELESRVISDLSSDDLEHLKIDCERVYKCLSKEWIVYMKHLQESYPYLFYSAIKINPYDSRNENIIEKELVKKLSNISGY